jgi:hypothetical protein
MSQDVAATIFYKITSSGSRNAIIEKLLHKKHGTTFNLFWNSYLKQLRPIDIRRNEIVHWLSASYSTIDENNMIATGVVLIHPAFRDLQQDSPRITLSDLRAFSEQCDVFTRLCNIFTQTTIGNRDSLDNYDAWLQIFQILLVYPLPANHPLFLPHAGLQTPHQSSPG